MSNESIPSSEKHDALARDAAATSVRLRDWLLRGPAQVHHGQQVGGVAGAVDGDGSPRYVYAEITGYYLSWLADIGADGGDAAIRMRASLAVAWARRAFARDGFAPQTRIYLADAEPDWRNDAIFFFDFAMLLRGLDAAVEAHLVEDAVELRGALHKQLAQFVDAERLRAAIQVRGTQALPPRWSTLGGPFLVKASSRVAHGASHAALPEALERACAAESDRWASGAADVDLGMLHPTLYFAEGLLLSHPERAQDIARLLNRCLELALADGSLPETAGEKPAATAPRVRNDIIAQALRVAILVRELGAASAPSAETLDRLSAALLARIGSGKFLSFNSEQGSQANVWCTMFAEQALRWYAGFRNDSARRPSAAALV